MIGGNTLSQEVTPGLSQGGSKEESNLPPIPKGIIKSPSLHIKKILNYHSKHIIRGGNYEIDVPI
jgi:hypothetical protein